MNLESIINQVEHCILGSKNERLTLVLKNGDKIVVFGKKTVVEVFYLINGRS